MSLVLYGAFFHTKITCLKKETPLNLNSLCVLYAQKSEEDNSLPTYQRLTTIENPLNPLNQDFKPYFQPGVYAIVNKKTQRRYIGETQNLAARFINHIDRLREKTHRSSSLQTDWDALGGINAFDFLILELGPHMESPEVRVITERLYIEASKDNVYNVLTNNLPKGLAIERADLEKIKTPDSPVTHKNSIEIRYKNQIFSSIAQASEHFQFNFLLIRRLLNDPNEKDWQYIDSSQQFSSSIRSRPIVVDLKDYYLNMKTLAAAYDIHPRTGYAKMRKGQLGWKYFDELTNAEKNQIPNWQEKIQKAHANSFFRTRPVILRIIELSKISYITFNTIHIAAKFVGCHYETIRRRVRSLQHPQWQWMDEMPHLDKSKIKDITELEMVDKSHFTTDREVLYNSDSKVNGKINYILFPNIDTAADYAKCSPQKLVSQIHSSDYPRWTWTNSLEKCDFNTVQIIKGVPSQWIKTSDIIQEAKIKRAKYEARKKEQKEGHKIKDKNKGQK